MCRAPVQQRGERVPIRPLFLQPDHQLRHGAALTLRQQAAQLPPALRRRVPGLSAGRSFSSTHGNEASANHGGIFRAEQEGRIGRPFLHQLQKDVLVLLR